MGTSTKGPITAADAAPELIPNTAIATAIGRYTSIDDQSIQQLKALWI